VPSITWLSARPRSEWNSKDSTVGSWTPVPMSTSAWSPCSGTWIAALTRSRCSRVSAEVLGSWLRLISTCVNAR
jgi:hypothetical protein